MNNWLRKTKNFARSAKDFVVDNKNMLSMAALMALPIANNAQESKKVIDTIPSSSNSILVDPSLHAKKLGANGDDAYYPMSFIQRTDKKNGVDPIQSMNNLGNYFDFMMNNVPAENKSMGRMILYGVGKTDLPNNNKKYTLYSGFQQSFIIPKDSLDATFYSAIEKDSLAKETMKPNFSMNLIEKNYPDFYGRKKDTPTATADKEKSPKRNKRSNSIIKHGELYATRNISSDDDERNNFGLMMTLGNKLVIGLEATLGKSAVDTLTTDTPINRTQGNTGYTYVSGTKTHLKNIVGASGTLFLGYEILDSDKSTATVSAGLNASSFTPQSIEQPYEYVIDLNGNKIANGTGYYEFVNNTPDTQSIKLGAALQASYNLKNFPIGITAGAKWIPDAGLSLSGEKNPELTYNIGLNVKF